MSCDVSSSLFSDHSINTEPCFDGKASGNKAVDLSAVADFNASFQFDQESIDPRGNFSNDSSPSYGLDQMLSPDPPNNLYPDFGSAPTSPYFKSIEPTATPFIPSPLRNQYLHRRSVSEPPNDAMLHHHRAQPSQEITFHRDGHKLGAPQTKSSYHPSAKRVKQSRVQPSRNSTTASPVTPQNRYQLRRANTQPSQRGPTSTPMGMMMRPPPPQFPTSYPPQQSMYMPFEPMQEESPYVMSRVCTPASEAVDPMLVGPQAPMVPQMEMRLYPEKMQSGNAAPVPKALVIKMGVEELRTLIHDVVQKAVQGLQAQKTSTKADGNMGQDDEIVDAGPSNTNGVQDAKVDFQQPIEE